MLDSHWLSISRDDQPVTPCSPDDFSLIRTVSHRSCPKPPCHELHDNSLTTGKYRNGKEFVSGMALAALDISLELKETQAAGGLLIQFAGPR